MQKLKSLYNSFKQWKWYKKAIALSLSLGILAICSIFILFLSVKWEIVTSLPSHEDIQSINNPLSTELYSKDGKLFGQFFEENRGDLNPEDLTEDFKNALIATEDVRFYKHSGIDYRALARVLFKSILLQRDNSGGGSTLTQQLAKNLYPRKRFKILSLPMNKFREMAIAQRLEKHYTKAELILLYTNTISFGERAFGLYTASNRFFAKTPDQLNLPESATLVGLLKAPTYYSPRKNPERSATRRNTVIKQMLKYDFLSEEEAKIAIESPMKTDYQPLSKSTGLARYFQQFVRKEFEAWADENPKENGDIYHIKRDGLKIHTTLNYNMQIAAEQSMKTHMKKLQSIFDRSWQGGRKYGRKEKHYKTELQRNDRYKALKQSGLSDSEIRTILQEKNPRSTWTWNGQQEKSISTEDSIKYYMSLLHTGILAVQPKTGHIETYVGGIDFGAFQYDNIQSKRQVGSTFKPIVYLTAMKRGVQLCDYFPNELRVYADYKDWQPENSDGKYGGYLSVTEAMTRSVNTVSVQMIFKAGIDNVLRTAKSLGITSKLPKVPSLVLGTADISLLEMVTAYAGIANGGEIPNIHSISKIEDAKGNILFESNTKRIQADSLAKPYAMIHDVMANVANEGTAARLYNYDIPFQVMGKTGTTQNQTDGWFIGFTSDLVIGSWVGAQNRGIHFRNLGTGSGGRTALPLVGSLFEFAASQGYSPTPLGGGSFIICPDSIGQEEYAYLQDNPYDFEGLRKNEIELDILDVLFGNEEDDVIVKQRRPRTQPAPKRKQRKNKRMSDFEKFKKEVERDLKDLFKIKKKKKTKKRKKRN